MDFLFRIGVELRGYKIAIFERFLAAINKVHGIYFLNIWEIKRF
jgi:hypothetical protein